jgi:hypothetical protein
LRQNRIAFLMLTTWLHRAGYIDQAEHEALNAAHIDARITAADEQQQQQQETKQHRIFLNILSDALATEMARLQNESEAEELLNDEDEAQGKHRQRGTPIGFRCKHNEVEAIALYPDAALKLVNEWRRSQGVQPLNKQVINTGLEREKLLLAQDKRQRTYQVRNPLTGEKVRVLLLFGDIFDVKEETGDCSYCLYSGSKQERNRDKNEPHSDEEKQVSVPIVPIVPTKNIPYIGSENSALHRGLNGNMNVCEKNAGTVGTTGASGVFPHQNGECVVPISETPKNEIRAIGTGDDGHDSLLSHKDEERESGCDSSDLDDPALQSTVLDRSNSHVVVNGYTFTVKSRTLRFGGSQYAATLEGTTAHGGWSDSVEESIQKAARYNGIVLDSEADDSPRSAGGCVDWLDEIAGITLPDGLPTYDEIIASVASIPDEAWDDDDDDDWELPAYIMHPMVMAAAGDVFIQW